MERAGMIPFRKTFENFACPPGGYTKIELCTIRRYKPPGLAPYLHGRVTEAFQCDPDYELEPGCSTGPVEIGVFGSIDNENPRLLFVCDTPECALEALTMLGIIAPLVPHHDERKTLAPHVTVAERVDPDTHRIVAAFNKPKRVSQERFSLAVALLKQLLIEEREDSGLCYSYNYLEGTNLLCKKLTSFADS
ncbi:hypothetical protein EBT31_21025, partial [bacterium]|nr:hypothetical protein [bacterium]